MGFTLEFRVFTPGRIFIKLLLRVHRFETVSRTHDSATRTQYHGLSLRSCDFASENIFIKNLSNDHFTETVCRTNDLN